jgi:hypothetical protein
LLAGAAHDEALRRALEALDQLGIGELARKLPEEVRGPRHRRGCCHPASPPITVFVSYAISKAPDERQPGGPAFDAGEEDSPEVLIMFSSELLRVTVCGC